MIGVFDSGLGGLTVLKHLRTILPEYSYIYVGDNAHLPYGNKSQNLIYGYTCAALDFLFAQGCNLVVIACNSASARALRKIQQEYLPKHYPDKKVLGVIRPLAEYVLDQKVSRVGVIGTKATIYSDIYKEEIMDLNPELEVWQRATPLLVPLIEENHSDRPESRMILKKYLRPLKEKKIQLLVLACTHYPFLLKDIRHVMGKSCQVPDPGGIVALSLRDYLSRHKELKVRRSPRPKVVFYTTDEVDSFKELGTKFLGQEIKNIKKISL